MRLYTFFFTKIYRNSKQDERKIKSKLMTYNGNESQFKKRNFCVNENVLYRNVSSNYVKWIPAKIIKKKLSKLRYTVTLQTKKC